MRFGLYQCLFNGDASEGAAAPVPDAGTSTITAFPTEVNADGVATSTITVQLKTAGGANITTGGATVVLNDGTDDLAVTDNGDGTYTAIVGPRS